MSNSDLETSSYSNNQTTGSFLVLFAENNHDQGIKTIQKVTGFSQVIKSSDFSGDRFNASRLASSDPIFFDTLGVAVVNLDSEQMKSIDRAIKDDSNPILAMEPERVVYAISETPPTEWIEYLKGYRDAVNHVTNRLIAGSKTVSSGIAATDIGTTWGLQVTKVVNSPYSGKNVKVAILDTGIDLNHPDFSGRTIVSQSFIDGETVQDIKGHGTHCSGTACGSKSSSISPRYGIALSGAEKYFC
jgi:subtilisin